MIGISLLHRTVQPLSVNSSFGGFNRGEMFNRWVLLRGYVASFNEMIN